MNNSSNHLWSKIISRKIDQEELEKSFLFQMFNKTTQNYMKNLNITEILDLLVDRVIMPDNLDEYFGRLLLGYVGLYPFTQKCRDFYKTLKTTNVSFVQQCLFENDDIVATHFSSTLLSFTVFNKRKELGIPDFISLGFTNRYGAMLFFEEDREIVEYLNVVKTTITKAFSYSNTYGIFTKKYLPINFSIGFSPKSQKSGHIIEILIVPCETSNSIIWTQILIDTSDVSQHLEEYYDSIQEIQGLIFKGWTDYTNTSVLLFEKPQKFQYVHCSRNTQGNYNTCQLWSKGIVLNFLKNMDEYRNAICNPRIVFKFCNVLELIQKIGGSHGDYFKIMYFIYSVLHLYNYEILLKDEELPSFSFVNIIDNIKKSTSNPQAISILKTVNKYLSDYNLFKLIPINNEYKLDQQSSDVSKNTIIEGTMATQDPQTIYEKLNNALSNYFGPEISSEQYHIQPKYKNISVGPNVDRGNVTIDENKDNLNVTRIAYEH